MAAVNTASRDSWHWRCRGSSHLVTCLCALPVSDRKSTRLNSSHLGISYAVFCLKKKKKSIVTTIEVINERDLRLGLGGKNGQHKRQRSAAVGRQQERFPLLSDYTQHRREAVSLDS